jgi:hypothetical protein
MQMSAVSCLEQPASFEMLNVAGNGSIRLGAACCRMHTQRLVRSVCCRSGSPNRLALADPQRPYEFTECRSTLELPTLLFASTKLMFGKPHVRPRSTIAISQELTN